MAENFTPLQIQTFVNDTSAVNQVNNNFSAISTAFTDVLSRSGVAPNQMNSTLDMNGNQIINLSPPQTVNSPARLIDVVTPGTITVTTATTGTSGHTVPFLDGTNTWSGSQTITVNGALVNGLNINLGITGSSGSNVNWNSFTTSDLVTVTGGNFATNFFVNYAFGGSTVQGGRQAVFGLATQTATTGAASSNRFYVGVVGGAVMSANDNGTGVTSGTSLGSVVGGNFFANASAPATNLNAVSGAEFNTTMAVGSSTWAKALAQFSGTTADSVAGSGINSMLWLYNQAAGSAKWTNAILIDNAGGIGSFPLSTTGTAIKTGAGTTTNGIDFTATTFTGNAFMSPGFSINGTGSIISGASGVVSGQVSLIGSAGGGSSINLNTNSTSTLLTISQPLQVGLIGSTAGQINIAGATSGSAQLSCSATGSTLQMGGGNLTVDTSGNLNTNASIRIAATTAPIAGGDTTHAYLMSTTTALGLYFGSGAPTITAAQGSIYIRTDGNSTSTRLYVNTTGSNVWTNFTSAA